MSQQKQIEIIARGVCIREGQILLCYGRKSGIAYLPGGHIDFGESGQMALEREIAEELGLAARAGGFIGCCEHCFVQAGEPHAEVNLLYLLEVPELDPAHEPQAIEDWIGFLWQPLARINEIPFEPAALAAVLPEWIQSGHGHLVTAPVVKN
ncbi:MAG: NUDIX domain-containing protein [Kiritimatiellae bacterium]|nr:NUDIX domain-containing protein [Kiritimatiellia bacterium]